MCYCEYINADKDLIISISNETIVHAFRLLVVYKKLSADNIVFKFHDGKETKTIKVYDDASLEDWCKGFCDTSINLISQILTLRNKNNKSNKTAEV